MDAVQPAERAASLEPGRPRAGPGPRAPRCAMPACPRPVTAAAWVRRGALWLGGAGRFDGPYEHPLRDAQGPRGPAEAPIDSRPYHSFSLRSSWSTVQLFSRSVVSDTVTPWTAARQASLSITNSRGFLRLLSIESVMPSNHLILCRPLLFLPSVFPSIKVLSNESVLPIRWPSIGVSASTSVLPMNIQH